VPSVEEPPVTLAELRRRGLAVDGLDQAVEVAEVAVEALADQDVHQAADAELCDAAVRLHRVGSRVHGAGLRILGAIDARDAFMADGAVTTASWYRNRVRMLPTEAHTLVVAARRLRDLADLDHALAAGRVSLRHVTTITRALTTDARTEAVRDHLPTLLALAAEADPRDLAIALRRITDEVDPDGSDADPLPSGPQDPRRELHLTAMIDGLWDLRGTLDTLTGEALAAFLDALNTLDAADTPPAERRRAPQRRHDALADLLERATGVADLPTTHGRPPHVLATIDLLALARLCELVPDGVLDDDRPAGRLRHGGAISREMALHLLARAAITLVQTEGPWRPVGVGRRMRALPAALRDLLDLLHQRCRGPDCDRPATWTDAHHHRPWADGGPTDVDNLIPLCRAHHRLLDRGWQTTHDPATGEATWTDPSGRALHVAPHRR
jgi:hypothetical protein